MPLSLAGRRSLVGGDGWVTVDQMGREALVGFVDADSGWPCYCCLWLLELPAKRRSLVGGA